MAIRSLNRKHYRALIVGAVLLTATFFLYDRYTPTRSKWYLGYVKSSFDWRNRRQQHPLAASSMAHPPSGRPQQLRRIQHDFSRDERDAGFEAKQVERRAAVKKTFEKCWDSYRSYAWGYDELMPVTLAGIDPYSGWGATLVDPLDTLWIMGMVDDFEQAVTAAATIDWDNSTSRSCSVFETNIRYVGGLLSAYELSSDRRLLDKALELAEMLYAAFDTPSRMPVNAFYFTPAKKGESLVPSAREVAASVGTLSLEFTKLTEFTGDVKFFDAIERIKLNLQGSQDGTKLPGLWPTYINLQSGFGTEDNSFTLGALADSLYEYLPKMYALLGGRDDTYAEMHKKAMAAATKHLLYRPMLPNKEDILFTGSVMVKGPIIDLVSESQHLACFTGGMYALGGKLLDIPEHVEIGEKLARGCAWAYGAMPTGVMPEISDFIPCDTPNLAPCEWNQTRWETTRWGNGISVPGFRSFRDKSYLLRPEAIESLFILYRITGKKDLLDTAWAMFEAIRKATETEHAHSAIRDVTVSGPTSKTDSMESFWLAETLKYFYLIFSEPDVISLDDYVLNTEAHPFKIAKPT